MGNNIYNFEYMEILKEHKKNNNKRSELGKKVEDYLKFYLVFIFPRTSKFLSVITISPELGTAVVIAVITL